MKDTIDLPLIGRAAEARADSVDAEARTVEIVWTTGATVQRVRWEGWDDQIEYDEELVVSPNAVRLDRLNAGAPFLDSHKGTSLDAVLGSVIPGSVRLEGGYGYAKVRLTRAKGNEDAVEKVMAKDVKISVGYRVHRYEIDKRDGQRELWRAVDWEPYEISAVAMPADAGAHIRSAATAAGAAALAPCVLIRQDDPAAQAAHPKGHTMTEETRAVDGDMTATETRAAPTAHPSQPDAETIRAAERQRSAEIMTLCQRHGFAEMATDLIATGASVDAARAALLDKLAARDPGGRVAETAPAEARSGGERELAFRDAVSTALMHRSNPGVIELTADAREFRGLSLLELARDVLERRGTSTRGLSKMELAGQAFAMRSGGFHSTSDFPSILANVANKTLRSAYESTPRTFAAWCRRAVITDFKPVSRTQLGGAPDLLKVLESSEIQYGTMGDGKEVYALASYARIVALTRQTIINDDLDAFTRVPAAFGAAAADLESDIVYSILIDNPDMADGTDLFHADHGNLLTAAVIGETSLADAYKAFGKQTGIEGRKISVLPRFLIVPPGARSVEARKNVTATTPDSVAGVNAFANRLEVVEEPRLIPATGQDPWFMAADPARIDTVEYAYLDGQEGVYTETEMGFEVDGLKIKARHDFAAKAIDWRGLLKNPGAAPA